uniref:FUN14 domain containing 1 n=1 Tax=Athene cunicularia TaxID=194338 RepID=A0A663MKM2_ATHCN
SVGFNRICTASPLVESCVWPEFGTNCRKIFCGYPDCDGRRDWLIASHSGYVQVDWKRVEKDVNKAKKQLKKRANKAAPEINTLIEESTEFIKQNIVVSSGFVGGFLLGLAS